MLEELILKLKEQKKYWIYFTAIDENTSEADKILLAEKVLKTPLAWSKNLANEINNKYSND